MDTKSQIRYLEEMLERDTKFLLESEARYRTFRSLAFTEQNQDVYAAESKAKGERDLMKGKVNFIKELMADLKNGKEI